MQQERTAEMVTSPLDMEEVIGDILAGDDLSEKDALLLFEECSLHLLTRSADWLRQETCGETVTFVVDRNINYTNVCTSMCRFCAFYRDEDSEDAYVLSMEEICSKVSEAVALGAIQILLQGGLHPTLSFEYYENLLENLKQRFPGVQLHAFSPAEIAHIAGLNRSSLKETLSRLKEAGLDSIPGGGAEILEDRIREQVSPNKIGWKTWRDVMCTAHELGIPTTATMVFGHVEKPAHRIRHLRRIRDIQRKTGGFTAFIPWSFQEKNTALESRCQTAGSVDYLRVLAISRLMLNNHIPNIQASWVTQGLKIAQIALISGANDLGGTMIEENVVRAAGVPFFRISLDEILHLARALGRPVAKRDTLYRILERY